MRRILSPVAFILLPPASALGQEHHHAGAPGAAQAQAMSPPVLKWGPAPPSIPAGAELAVLQGDPAKPELFTVRLRMPSGYKIMPHFHPTDESLTVIDGTFMVGMGDAFNRKMAMALKTGAFLTAAANQHHYAWARGATIVQVHGMGPFTITYVNPADDPRTGKSTP